VLSGGFYGSERYCIELAIAQARAGHDVAVVAQDPRSTCVEQFRRSAAEALRDGGFAGSLQIMVLPRALPSWLQRPAAWILLRRFRPAVVHTHLNPAARRVGRVAERLRIAHVATLLIRYEEREHGTCDGLIAVTQAQRNSLPEGARRRAAVIWLSVPTTSEEAIARVSAAEVEALRRQWRAGESDVVFGSVGRLVSVKGMDVLLSAFEIAFPADERAVRLVLVGDGEDRAQLERLADGDDRIVFAGHQSEIAPFFRAFDVFVSAARFEPFGIAILEAMAARCRLVTTRAEGPSEFLTDSRVRWADPDRSDELATQLRAAAASKRERWDYDLSPFTVDRLAANIEDFYRRILGSPAGLPGD
jgi:glycosyltransferase involved in cell wall biosynthesis